VEEVQGMQHVASLQEIADLFGSEPRLEYSHLPYYDNAVTVEAELEHHSIWLQYMPCQAWGELRVVGKPFSVVKLLLSDISHLSVRKTEEEHALAIKFARKQTSTLHLSLRPRVMLFWGNQGDVDDDIPILSTVGRAGDA
jgi:hypothetical protein